MPDRAVVAKPEKLNLMLLGNGKMGKAVAALAAQHGFQVQGILDEFSNADFKGITAENFKGVDVCLDFTTPEAAVENIRRVARLGCNLVVGTTGWHSRLEEVRQIIEDTGVGLVYGANFSVGVQLFYRAAQAVAEIFRNYPAYEPYIAEAHHRFKKDAPSGTALELKRRVEPVLDSREVPVASLRAGYIPGTHELGFDSEADTVILRHTARGRQGFAEGALYAARWVAGRKGLFAFAEILE
ncbi:MAG TPA: 4-hydroxy-tetrahydrodipicolinate reductase [Terriglobia bacterium]|nr:4-hydroxy-tetrahydrodipicolinate reductase [Terriglobia bacterium]